MIIQLRNISQGSEERLRAVLDSESLISCNSGNNEYMTMHQTSHFPPKVGTFSMTNLSLLMKDFTRINNQNKQSRKDQVQDLKQTASLKIIYKHL